ncbi:MAG: hypothetical protein ACI857_000277 [Arenicella sp.]|jgi:hypothetical protein
MKKGILLLILMLSLTFSFAFDNDLTSICLRPGTTEMYIGGEFKTIFVIDKKTGAEIRRLTVEKRVIDLQFSPDGKNLIVFDGQKVMLMNPETGAETYSLKGSRVRLFENSPYFIDSDLNYSGSVVVYSTTDGSQVFKHTPTFKPLDASFDSEFKELIILGKSMDIKGEKNLITKKVEESDGYNVYNKAYVDQQSDKKGSGFEVIDIESKSSKINVVLPYQTAKSFGLSISKFNENYYLSCWDMMLKIDKEGMSSPISCSDATFAYATNALQNSKTIMVSSTKNGFVFNCENEEYITFDARENNEFAYSTDITYDHDLIYVLNKDFTISILNEKSMVVNRIKIDNSTGKGFGVYYYNGYSKKEARDKEANIINEVGATLDLPVINLEDYIGSGDVLIGTFDSIEKAEEFKKRIKSKGLSYITKIAPIE